MKGGQIEPPPPSLPEKTSFKKPRLIRINKMRNLILILFLILQIIVFSTCSFKLLFFLLSFEILRVKDKQ